MVIYLGRPKTVFMHMCLHWGAYVSLGLQHALTPIV